MTHLFWYVALFPASIIVYVNLIAVIVRKMRNSP
jgi:hypothetical protein